MTRRYTDHRELADSIVERPEYYGVRVFRYNPCCDTAVRVSFHERQLDSSFEDAAEALVYLRGLTNAVERLVRATEARRREDFSLEVCEGCVEAPVRRRLVLDPATSMGISNWLDDHGVPEDAR